MQLIPHMQKVLRVEPLKKGGSDAGHEHERGQPNANEQ